MATLAGIVNRARLEIGDSGQSFQTTATLDGTTRRYELAYSPVDPSTLRVFFASTQILLGPTDYLLDAADGVITIPTAPMTAGDTLVVQGTSYRYFTDQDWQTFAGTAATQHLYNRTGVSLATMPPVEEYPLALLAAIEALYALLNDAAFDIDVSSPEGVGIPRSQRFRQLQEMIALRKEQYQEICGALNVGLNRIEMFTLRRVSRTTNRLVPVYQPQEIDDRQPPVRAFIPIDTLGAPALDTPVPVLDIEMYEYGYFGLDLTGLGDLTGWKVDARLRRYVDSSSIREMTVVVNDLVAGNVSLGLTPTQTALLPQRLFWDLRLTNRTTREVRTLRKGRVTVIQQVGVDESIGPAWGNGY